MRLSTANWIFHDSFTKFTRSLRRKLRELESIAFPEMTTFRTLVCVKNLKESQGSHRNLESVRGTSPWTLVTPHADGEADATKCVILASVLGKRNLKKKELWRCETLRTVNVSYYCEFLRKVSIFRHLKHDNVIIQKKVIYRMAIKRRIAEFSYCWSHIFIKIRHEEFFGSVAFCISNSYSFL